MKRLVDLVVSSLKIIGISILLRTFFRNKISRNSWLICEKPDEARDNGFHFFRYVRTNHPNVNAYYVIEKEAPDIKKLLEFGNIVYFGSFEHYCLYLTSSMLISSQTLPYPSARTLCEFLKFTQLTKPKKIWLQHGITKDKLPHNDMDYSIFRYDLLVCTSDKERDFVKKEYNYPEQVVQTLGMCRYDRLLDNETDNSILIMPTYRKWLAPSSRVVTTIEKENFKKSEFFHRYMELLNSEEINTMLNKKKYKIYFYLHYGLQPYSSIFKESLKHRKNIIIADAEQYDVQQLLIKNKLLITDYSSVFFDFAYMNKPVMLYQFDRKDFHDKHYEQGYFDFRTFGVVSTTYEDLLKEIKKRFEQKMEMEEIYKERVIDFFKFRDNRNCERTFIALKQLNK